MMKRNGVYEWIFQRVSSVLIFAFAAFYIATVIFMEQLNYDNWVALHSALWFKVYATATLVIVMLNAILAGWQIGTDYTQKVPVAGFATLFHGFYIGVTLMFLAAGIYIIWLM
jgi:succinate dehydrogenase / fumarate reductase membrane anchor subunit